MDLTFEHPFPYLWSILLAGLLGWIAWRSRAGKRPYLAIGLRAALAACMLLALANPVRRQVDFPEQRIVFLVDGSNSIGPSALAQMETFVQRVNIARNPDARLGMIAFARSAEVVQPLSAGFTFHAPKLSTPTDATHIALAIHEGLNQLSGEDARALVLFSDGNETDGDSRASAERARREGVVVHTVPVERNAGNVWGVEKLFAPSRVRLGERFRIRALLANDAGNPVLARLILRKDGQVIKTENSLPVQPGTTPVTMEYRLDETGLHAFDLRVEYENGASSMAPPVFVDAVSAPRVLIVGPAADAGDFFSRAISGRNLMVDERTALPDRLEALLEYDGVILNDVKRETLTDEHVRMLQQYVQDFGGGVVVIGGGAEASLADFAGTSFETLLPVRLAERHSIVKKRRDFVLMLLIDRSGSMTGEKMDMARAAAINAVEGLEPGDSIGVIAFDDQAYPVVDLTVLGPDKSSVIDNIRRLTPGGGTDARTALVEAFRLFSTRRINIRKHVILMTDGITVERQLLDITRRLKEKEVTLSTIAIGADANVSILDQMRQIGGGAFHLITNFSELPRIVVKDMGDRVKESDDIDERFTPELFDPNPMTAGIRPDDIPALKGYVASTLKTAAIKPLMTNFRNMEDPILAGWQYGLGRSVVMMAGVNSVWSDEWLRWRAFGKLWEQIVRWTIRTRSPQDYFFSIHHDGGRLNIRVETEGATGALPALAGVLRFPDRRMVGASFVPLADGTYEGAFAAPEAGMAYMTLIEEGVSSRPVWSGPVYLPEAAAAPAASEEMDGRPANHRLLQDLAAATGGMFDPRPEDILLDPEGIVRATDYRGPLLILALLLFLTDIAARRFDVYGG